MSGDTDDSTNSSNDFSNDSSNDGSSGADTSEFDKAYWEQHWQGSPGEASAPNPHLVREVDGLTPGAALDAGCGEGAEARWLAGQGWEVTAVDISREALERAAALEEGGDGSGTAVEWVEADLTTWAPDRQYDLVTTHYAHPTIPQLDFYDRIAGWVAPEGSLLIVGHLHRDGLHGGTHGHGHDERHDHTYDHSHGAGDDPGGTVSDDPPEHATVTLVDITARLDPAEWDVQTAAEHTRPTEHGTTLHDVVVRARRRG